MKSGLAEGGPLGFSDAAKRASDVINMHLVADDGNRGRWVAIRLSDGGSDGTTYADLAPCVNAQLHYRQCMYLIIPAGGMQPAEADVMLGYHRRVYDAGNLPPYLQELFRAVGL